MHVATLLIAPNADDIAHGERGNCSKCPIARWVMRTIPRAVRVSVDLETIAFDVDGEVPGIPGWERGTVSFGLKTPEPVGVWMNDFDRGMPVRPKTFAYPLDDRRMHHRALIAILEGRERSAAVVASMKPRGAN